MGVHLQQVLLWAFLVVSENFQLLRSEHDRWQVMVMWGCYLILKWHDFLYRKLAMAQQAGRYTSGFILEDVMHV